MFKSHLDMIGRNEPVSKKAKFWQSYVRSLKGSEDIRADDRVRARRSILPELTSTWPYTKSIFEDPIHASDRISVPGYRYLPIHRETYGYSPRPIYAHNYPSSLDRYRPIYHVPKRRYEPFDTQKAWQDHLDRLRELDRLYPSRYGLYLRDRACPIFPSKGDDLLKGIEYEPDSKPKFGFSGRAPAKDPFAEADEWLKLDRAARGRSPSPTPTKPGEFAPRDTEVAFDRDGMPIYNRGGLLRKPWDKLLNPSPSLPLSAIFKDPFWWDYPELKPFFPFGGWGRSPSYVRDSFLSPVKRSYLWDKHPLRPLGWSIYDRYSNLRRPWSRVLSLSPYLSLSTILDPFWWDYPEWKRYRFTKTWSKYPYYISDSFLSPVKRSYYWYKYPLRPYVYLS